MSHSPSFDMSPTKSASSNGAALAPSPRMQVPGMFALSPNAGARSKAQVAYFTESAGRAAGIAPAGGAEDSSPPTPKLEGGGHGYSPGKCRFKSLVYRKQTAVKLDQATVSLLEFDALVTLGTGTFGRVQLVRQKKAKQAYFALKTMKKQDIIRLKQVDHIISEAALLGALSHPFIVNLCSSFQDTKRLYMIMEFVPGGELFSYLRRERKISDESARFYASEIVLALDYLHNKDVAYRDLKPENLLLSRSGHLKIADFGFAKKVESRTWTLCGTPEYLAPEIIQSKGHSKCVDWWALGILLFEMLAGYPPFYEETPLAIYQKILRGFIEWPPFFDSRARDIISKLLTPDSTKRLGCLVNGAEDVANEPWFASVHWQSTLDRFVSAPFFPPVSHPGDTANFDEYEEEDEVCDDCLPVKLEDDARFAKFGSYKNDGDRVAFVGTRLESDREQLDLSRSIAAMDI